MEKGELSLVLEKLDLKQDLKVSNFDAKPFFIKSDGGDECLAFM